MALAADVTAPPHIVKDGEPPAQIVVAEQPTRMQTLAAKQLRAYITYLQDRGNEYYEGSPDIKGIVKNYWV